MIDVYSVNLVSRTEGFEASGPTLLLVPDEQTPLPAPTTILRRTRLASKGLRDPSNGYAAQLIQTNFVAGCFTFAGDSDARNKCSKAKSATDEVKAPKATLEPFRTVSLGS